MSPVRNEDSRESDAADRSDSIQVRDRDGTEFVHIEEIHWIEAAGDYVVLHTDGRRHLIRATMSGMTKRLPQHQFIRIHRSIIVNLDKVLEVRAHLHGDYLVFLASGQELRLSRRYWPHVQAQFNALR